MVPSGGDGMGAETEAGQCGAAKVGGRAVISTNERTTNNRWKRRMQAIYNNTVVVP